LRETDAGIRIQRPSGEERGQNITEQRCMRIVNKGTGERIAKQRGLICPSVVWRLKYHDELSDNVKKVCVRN